MGRLILRSYYLKALQVTYEGSNTSLKSGVVRENVMFGGFTLADICTNTLKILFFIFLSSNLFDWIDSVHIGILWLYLLFFIGKK